MKKLPLGKSSFPKMIEEGYIYVDKTKEIYDMIEYSPYVFLSRPRRFGKSLLVSTLEALFQGKKELFKGLWVEDKIDWQEYPVIRIDFGVLNYDTIEEFKYQMARVLKGIATQYDIVLSSTHYVSQIRELVLGLYQDTGKEVVVLIDEYDAPIARHITNLDTALTYHTSLRDFYSVLKALNHELKFTFMTGISKFTKMSIFSVINSMQDVSLLPSFSKVAGFTHSEVQQYFGKYIQQFSEKENLSKPELMAKIVTWYDGYSWDGKNRMFNPYSIVKSFNELRFKNYWFETGTPSILIKLIREKYAQEIDKAPTMKEFENKYAVALDSSYDLYQQIPLTKLLYETGYLTIKKIEIIDDDDLYTMGYPNHEVRKSFNSFILAAFSNSQMNLIQSKGTLMKKALMENDKDAFLNLLRSLFGALPYQHRQKASEAYYHGLFYLILTLLGVRANLEDSTDKGRIDCILELGNKVYVIEFKYGEKGTMDYLINQAMTQIDNHKYYESFEGSGKEVWLLGVGFLVKEDKVLKKAVLTIEAKVKQHIR